MAALSQRTFKLTSSLMCMHQGPAGQQGSFIILVINLVVVKELGEEVGELVHLQKIWRESVRMTRSKKIISSSMMIIDR